MDQGSSWDRTAESPYCLGLQVISKFDNVNLLAMLVVDGRTIQVLISSCF